MLLIINEKGDLVIITRQNPKGGPALKSYTIAEDPDSGTLGYRIGYCDCGCQRPLFIRTLEIREMLEIFGYAVDRYDSVFARLKPKVSIRHRIIKMLGGKVGD
jgi:hypothetical protein